jgi:tetraacyldisaccharide 4'-kinase
LHRAFARASSAGAPVISVGNLTAGGAGKTPVTLELVRRLSLRGRKPAVLSRGYGRLSSAVREVDRDADPREVGDEPLMLARRGCRVFVGPRRDRLARLALQAGADVLLLDDGLQHHRLSRDLDVIVADASNPLGNGRLLPAGPLREPPSSLRRVRRGLIWLTWCDQPRDPRVAVFPPFPLVESVYAAQPDLRGKRIFLFAGVARPERVLVTARSLGAEIAGVRWFPDHHWFSERELDEVRRSGALPVTTEKDLARIASPEGIVALSLTLRIVRGEEALESALGAAS